MQEKQNKKWDIDFLYGHIVSSKDFKFSRWHAHTWDCLPPTSFTN